MFTNLQLDTGPLYAFTIIPIQYICTARAFFTSSSIINNIEPGHIGVLAFEPLIKDRIGFGHQLGSFQIHFNVHESSFILTDLLDSLQKPGYE